ncbi:MAG: hypothetical protein IBJ18_09600 [Phycisphaerales bacterium]|nr:hypothetical protein [Phycisphaerales bacterium]
MSWSERIAKIDSVQQSMLFKLVASGVIVLGMITALVWYSVSQSARAEDILGRQISVVDPTFSPEEKANIDEARKKVDPGQLRLYDEAIAEQKGTMQTVADIVNRLSEQSLSTGRVTLIIVGAGAVGLTAVWAGLGLTYFGVLVLGGGVSGPMIYLGAINTGGYWPTVGGLGKFSAAVLCLSLAFSTLVRGAAMLLSGATPVLAIARNVIHEAVRMKISLVFIVMLILALAALPGALESSGPLRYKVQNFLQYGTGGSYLLTAILVVFLSAATVSQEQRDKIIWQTMTKPVKAWEYVLGKWLGVSIVGALLLGVSATGVYLFTEYLRHQKALGEEAPFVASRQDPTAFSEDRFVLEFQVLAGRATINPYIPPADAAGLEAEVQRRVKQMNDARDRDPREPEPDVQRIAREVAAQKLQEFLSVAPAQIGGLGKKFSFDGMQAAKRVNLPMMLRYKVNAGNNSPTESYRLTFVVGRSEPRVVTVNLGQAMTLPVYPKDIGPDGRLDIFVYNGDIETLRGNPQTITFSAGDGLQISYPVSTFAPNYLRAMLVLWLKMVFLTSVAICAGTFLSFSVSCLMGFGVFLMAESASFVQKAVENYSTTDNENKTIWYKEVVAWISENVSMVFKTYAELSPISSVVEGKYLAWESVAQSGVILLLIGTLMFAIGSAIFRQRELAIYSGN